MSFEIRPITDEEIVEFRSKLTRGFGGDLSEDDGQGVERFRAIMPLERTRAAFDGGAMVGTLGDFPLRLTVPGGEIAMAGTTMVSVQTPHRRIGILRSMMKSHLDAVREAGEPAAGLWASESSIYARFGFGVASYRQSVEMDAGGVAFTDADVHGSVRFIDTDEALEVLPPILDTMRRARPGMLGRSPDFWRWRWFFDPESKRSGSSAIRIVVHSSGEGDDGYAIYRQKEKWDEFLAAGEVSVREVVAPSPGAHTDLWRYLTNVDLFPKVSYWNLPIDDELPLRITDPRRIARSTWDALWVRLIDVPAALAARSYGFDGRLCIDVVDEEFPENAGTFEIIASDGNAECRKVTADADVGMSVDALGAVYLGGRRLSPMARAGHVHGSSDAVRRADRFLGWYVAPWCQEVF